MPDDSSEQQQQQQQQTLDEAVMARCQRAAELIFEGQLEAACEALAGRWRGVGKRPALESLGEAAAAEVLLRCGALSGALGSRQHMAGTQEAAKDLLSESLRIFLSLDQPSKVAEARYELGICYWRLGGVHEASLILAEALNQLGMSDAELKAKILIRLTVVEVSAQRYLEAWEILKEAEQVFKSAGDAWKGRWHNQKALVMLRLATTERRMEYADRAVIEFTAAIVCYERANHDRFSGNTLNDLALLLNKLGRHGEAHEHLDRARAIFTRLKDEGSVAQVDETRARVLVSEARYAEARKVIIGTMRALREGGGEQAMLADALVVQGVVLARLGDYEDSVELLQEAIITAEVAGAPNSAGHAALTLLEEHGQRRLSKGEVYEAYRRADELLARTQDVEDLARLRGVARQLISGWNEEKGATRPSLVASFDEFPKEVRTYCEQYLLYFIQFLQDLGVEATSDIKHEAGHVLFTVTPRDEREALEKIWAALKIYLNLPGNTIKSDASSDIAVKRLEYAVMGLQRELRLAEAELQAKNATIEAQQLTINVQKGLLSGEFILNSPNDAAPNSKGEDREELFGGVAAITVLEKPGFEINLPKLYRSLKDLFTKQD